MAGYLYHCAKNLGLISIEQCWQVRFIFVRFVYRVRFYLIFIQGSLYRSYRLCMHKAMQCEYRFLWEN